MLSLSTIEFMWYGVDRAFHAAHEGCCAHRQASGGQVVEILDNRSPEKDA